MWDQSKNEGGIQNGRTFNIGMWDKNILVGGVCSFWQGGMLDNFKIGSKLGDGYPVCQRFFSRL